LDGILQRVASLQEDLEQEGIAKQADAMKEKHGNFEETQAASVFSSDAAQQVATDESERGIIATDHGNVTHPTMPTQVTGVSQVAANTNCTISSQLY
jgi:hypothetical protein